MKNLFKSSMLVAIIAAAFVGCSKDATSDVENVISGNTVTVNFDASVEDETRATLTPNDGETAFAAAWEDGDKGDKIGIYAYALDNSTTAYTKTNVKGTRTGNEFEATFTGAPAEIASAEYCAYYPYTTAAGTLIPFGSERTQIGNNYNSAYDIMISDKVNVDCEDGKSTTIGKDAAGNAIVFPMKRQTAIAYFHFKTEDENIKAEKVVSAKLSVTGNDNIAAETIAVSYKTDNTISLGARNTPSKTITITFDAATAPTAADFTAWFNVLPCTFESMTLELETENYTATISRNGAGEYVAGKLYKVSGELTKWVSKPVEVAPDGTILWSENWTGYSKDTQPSDATNVYNNEVVTYTYGKAGTKVYEENLAKGTAPELLLARDGGLWNIHNIPTGNCKLATLSFKINKSSDTFCAISTDTNGVSISEVSITESYVHEYAITFSDGVKTFDLKFSNSSSSNSRLDDIELVVGKKIHKATPPTITVDSKDAGNGTFTASWTAIDGISQYAWRLTDKDNESQNVQSGTTEDTSVAINNLDTAKQYVLYVKSVGDKVNYLDSDEASVPISFGGTFEPEYNVAYTFNATGIGSGYNVHTGVCENNGIKWTVTFGQGTYIGTNSKSKSNCKLGEKYAKVGTPMGYTNTTTQVAAIISEGKMSNISKISVSGDTDQYNPDNISLVYSEDGETYTLVSTESYNKGNGNTWEFSSITSAYYAIVIQYGGTSYMRTNNLKVEYYTLK